MCSFPHRCRGQEEPIPSLGGSYVNHELWLRMSTADALCNRQLPQIREDSCSAPWEFWTSEQRAGSRPPWVGGGADKTPPTFSLLQQNTCLVTPKDQCER